MKGLRQYLKKHGYHFTEALVVDVVPIRWNYKEIERTMQKEVWYNCWSATIGDILYLVNVLNLHASSPIGKRRCTKWAMSIVGNYSQKELCFRRWLASDMCVNDFTPYI